MRNILIALFAVPIDWLLGAMKTSAAVTCGGTIDTAASTTAMVFTTKYPIVQHYGYCDPVGD
jgi:hypothetical protein